MLCASCASDQPEGTQTCDVCAGPAVLGERWVLLRTLEASGVGMTYLARGVDDAQQVVIKELSFGRMESLKHQELFEREAQLLRELDHPRLPQYIDDFVWGVGKHQAHYLVESYIPGPTLGQQMRARQYSERDVLAMLDELCGVLEYLHTRTPAVLHRDIKPDNIICHAQTGELCLIDFGSARDHMTRHATTVVGTFGFMAPEQLVAQATPASDLYALGILGVVLLTKMDVLELINEDHVMDWGPHVRASAPTVALLEDLTRRSARERLSEACVVRARIHEILHPTRAPSGALIKAPSESLPDAVPKTESLFGVICLMLAVPLMAAPCMVALVGFEYTAVGVSIALLGVILMTPFLPSAPAPSHKALPPPEPAAKRER